ncbi:MULTISPECIES: SAM-dependent methyltransferase [unclassified Streptomyces]|uniref:SAM-dependent methyltransferase n=1 Tax=Streptomycetaceae TaxID=2062 RepID=UPI002E75BFBC|nr:MULTISPECIES: SAM-dependent methyltransferase [unclassified Streptomyces]MED7954992.1 SAM-dependent methyltransferase [Streptomyces sp. BE303]MEE1828001.1 SAM-dependent methyltransferase [Streptomyces sp. BE20]
MTTSQDFADQPDNDAAELSQWEKYGVDTSAPHSARVYDYWLGGKTNFPPDRAMGQAIEQAVPSVKAMAKENRAFQGRAVRHLAEQQGIRQFLDLGTGIPTSPNTHEIAEAASPGTRVVYVDNDPIVLAHARALMVSTPASRTTYIHADLGKPAELLSDPALTSTLDLSQPVGLLMIAVLMLIADEDDPWGKVAALRDALPAGSFLALTHPTQDFDPVAVGKVADAARAGGMTLVPRTKEEVSRFFDGWELIEPGVSPVMAWHPDGEQPADPYAAYYWGGVARKL